MTGQDRPVCDCPEPFVCYAEGYVQGKDKAYFEMLASLEGPAHGVDCACRPCQVKTACIGALLTMMANQSPELFDQVEAWVLDAHDDERAAELILTHPETSTSVSDNAQAGAVNWSPNVRMSYVVV